MRGHAMRRRRAVGGHAPVRRRRATSATRGVAIERHGRRRRCRGWRAGHRTGPRSSIRTRRAARSRRGTGRHAAMGRMARRRWHARMRGGMMSSTWMGRHRTRRRRGKGPSRRRRCAGGQTHHGTAMRLRRRRRGRWRWSFHRKWNIAAFRKQKVLFTSLFFLDRRAFLPFLFRFGVCGFQLPTHARGSTRYARACRCTVLLSDWPPRDGEMSALPDQTSSGNDSIQKPSDIDIDQSEPWVLSLCKRARNMIRKNGEQMRIELPTDGMQ